MAAHGARYRTLYRDIDSMGVLYYGRYLALFELGRVEWMRREDCRYRDLEDQHGILLPVTEAHCDYRSPVRYDDLALVRTEVASWSASRVRFRHRVVVPQDEAAFEAATQGDATFFPEEFWEESHSQLCALGEVELGCVLQGSMRPTRLPEPFRELLTRTADGQFRPKLTRKQP
jgi:acyl-CoA thioester hydrolase